MTATFRRLTEVGPADLVALHNHPLVRRTLPLSRAPMDEAAAQRFIRGKEQLWVEHGYGPWAFFVGDTFAGWGGLQPEGEDADLALVLHPDFWGLGRQLVPEVLRRAWTELRLSSVSVLLPPGRAGSAGLTRLGFVRDGEAAVGGLVFVRYRLRNPDRAVERSGHRSAALS